MSLIEAITQWHYPTDITFGNGSIDKLENILSSINSSKPLLVVDHFLLQQQTIINTLSKLKNNNIEISIFSAFKGNPTTKNVTAAIKICKQSKSDSIIALGGGSALDVAKTIAVAANTNTPVLDFIDNDSPLPNIINDDILPIIAIPTTSGTGSEVSRASLIIDTSTHEKHILFHPNMLPSKVICDPSLTTTCPPQLTAWAGMDALAHNLEALCSPNYNPQADGIAYEGIRLIKENLITAFKQGCDITARTHLMSASLMGASAFQKGLGAIHSLSHPVGGLYDAHHGLLNAIFMPYVLMYNRSYIESKMARLARFLNLKQHSFDGVFSWITHLQHELNIPDCLAAIDIDDKQTELIAERALRDPSSSTNPRPLNLKDCRQLFDAALQGSIELTPA
jgi:alcohol dehydrogenase class IV